MHLVGRIRGRLLLCDRHAQSYILRQRDGLFRAKILAIKMCVELNHVYSSPEGVSNQLYREKQPADSEFPCLFRHSREDGRSSLNLLQRWQPLRFSPTSKLGSVIATGASFLIVSAMGYLDRANVACMDGDLKHVSGICASQPRFEYAASKRSPAFFAASLA